MYINCDVKEEHSVM